MATMTASRRQGPAAGARRVDVTLVFLGFGLQLLQVGIIPLIALISADEKLTTV